MLVSTPGSFRTQTPQLRSPEEMIQELEARMQTFDQDRQITRLEYKNFNREHAAAEQQYQAAQWDLNQQIELFEQNERAQQQEIEQLGQQQEEERLIREFSNIF